MLQSCTILKFWLLHILGDMNPRAHKIVSTKFKKNPTIHQTWKYSGLKKSKLCKMFVGYNPSCKLPPNFSRSLGLVCPESISADSEWPKSIKACSSYASANKTRTKFRGSPPSPLSRLPQIIIIIIIIVYRPFSMLPSYAQVVRFPQSSSSNSSNKLLQPKLFWKAGNYSVANVLQDKYHSMG